MKNDFTLDFSQDQFEEKQIQTKFSHRGSPIMIKGVAIVLSDAQDDDDQDHKISSIKQSLQQFKENKARKIVNQHKRTKQSILEIISTLKKSIEDEAIYIIKSHINSHQTNIKEDISTIPSPTNRKSQSKDRDLVNSKGEAKYSKNKNYKEFTLGQKNRYFSNKNQRHQVLQTCQVSQFQCQTLQKINLTSTHKVARFSDLYKHN